MYEYYGKAIIGGVEMHGYKCSECGHGYAIDVASYIAGVEIKRCDCDEKRVKLGRKRSEISEKREF